MKRINYLFVCFGVFLLMSCEEDSAVIPSDKFDKYVQLNTSWTQLPGRASDIGVGSNGTLYVIGEGNNHIFRWTGSNYVKLDGAGVCIDVASDGTPWVINPKGWIYRRDGNAWTRLPGGAVDIGVGSNGSVYVISSDKNRNIYRWSGSRWINLGGSGQRITVDNNGTPWVINNKGEIYRRDGNNWTRLPGKASDIGAGSDGTVYIVGYSGFPEECDPIPAPPFEFCETTYGGGQRNKPIAIWSSSINNWVLQNTDGSGILIDCRNSSEFWVVNEDGYIYTNN